MNIMSEIKVQYTESTINIEILSSNDSLLIGKHGKNLQALNWIINQYVYKITKEFIEVKIDINNYQKKRAKELEKLVKNIAGEVQKSKIDVKLTSMNSYERKIVHHLASEYSNIYTVSEGEEPNRYIVIKYNSSK